MTITRPGAPLALYPRQNADGWAVVVPKRVAPRAVTRNTIRRRVRETLRTLAVEGLLGVGGTVRVLSADIPRADRLRKEVLKQAKDSGILNQ